MKGVDGLERRFVQWLTGSPHPNYRQPLWRNLHDEISDATGWSEKIGGDPDASSITSRKWRKAVVAGVDPFVWNDMVGQYPEGTPALIFRYEDMPLRIGYLSSHEDLGRLRMLGSLRVPGQVDDEVEVHPYVGHGLRVGRRVLQFTIALAGPEGILTPPQEAVISQGPINIATIGQPGSNYEHMYFSS